MGFLATDEIWNAFKIACIFIAGFVILFIPHNLFLPFEIDWLYNKSLLAYINEHLDFFLRMFTGLLLFSILLILWRKR